MPSDTLVIMEGNTPVAIADGMFGESASFEKFTQKVTSVAPAERGIVVADQRVELLLWYLVGGFGGHNRGDRFGKACGPRLVGVFFFVRPFCELVECLFRQFLVVSVESNG